MSDKVSEMIERVLIREGRDTYTNDPSDAGGPTKWGITQGALAKWRGRPVTALDVQALAKDEAVAIYRRDYMAPFEAIEDESLLELMFDFAVNHGPRRAAEALQTVLQRIGYYKDRVDGDFGRLSREALAKVQNMAALFYAVKCERLEAYMRYAGRAPANVIYLGGWANRNDQFERVFADAGAAGVSVA
ncbi:glycosyl hydrolase 108 family protein [uncultured Reyranella sp.]|uniref:glycoside hydrolase family 108 protein n=1 Tax=uncultured Reyranella sp. TaxID=735512 RepID=UPI00259C7BB0|nr:glycosyl hydrolase 108 family protein [uncultured Reyranella sp.]